VLPRKSELVAQQVLIIALVLDGRDSFQANHRHCDQIGRNFALWAIFFGVGRIFF
jgi:hypothetical protein